MMSQDEALDYFSKRAQKLCPWPWFSPAIEHVHNKMEQDGGHDWSHLTRVLNAAHTIYLATQPDHDDTIDWQVIAVAVLFHDVVNLPKDHPDRSKASTFAAAHAVEYAQSHLPLTAPQHERLEEAIRCHSFSSGFRATSIEAMIVSDADRFDALGAFGIARTFAVGGMLNRPLAHPSDPLARDREPDDSIWSVDHFFVKLFKLPDLMYTEAGREEANQRVDVMRAFLNELEKELLGQTNV